MRQSTFVANHWLGWFYEPEGRFPNPIRMPDGKKVMATEGTMAIVADIPGFQTLEPPLPRHKAAAFAVADWLAADASKSADGVDAAALRRFADEGKPAREIVTCPFCKGKGHTMHVCGCDLCDETEEECEDCEGDGTVVNEDDEPRWGILFGQVFDRRLIGYLLEHAPAEPQLKLELTAEKLRIVTPAWSAIIMCSIIMCSKQDNVPPYTPTFNV